VNCGNRFDTDQVFGTGSRAMVDPFDFNALAMRWHEAWEWRLNGGDQWGR
jgi:hypothetical protein